MARRTRRSDEPTYPLGVVTRITGLSDHVVRAWERRYKAVEPIRTAGGTRRYRERDVERLRLLAAAVATGHAIGEVARLDDEELRARVRTATPLSPPALPATLDALTALDAAGAEQQLSFQLSALGPARFAREFAVPLLREIGEGWSSQRVCIASEHLATALLRSLLGGALRPTAVSSRASPVVFATPSGERHELGVLIAALTAQAAGGNPVFLGPDLPAEELWNAVDRIGAAALALGLTVLPARELGKVVGAIRAGLHDDVELWVGGCAARDLEPLSGVQVVADLEDLERKVGLLALRGGPG